MLNFLGQVDQNSYKKILIETSQTTCDSIWGLPSKLQSCLHEKKIKYNICSTLKLTNSIHGKSKTNSQELSIKQKDKSDKISFHFIDKSCKLFFDVPIIPFVNLQVERMLLA